MRCHHCGHENLAGEDVCADCGHDLVRAEAGGERPPAARDVLDEPLDVLPLEPPPTVEPDTPLADVVELLVRRDVGAVLIMHECNLLGIFSERDLVTKVGERYAELRQEPVRRFMTPRPETLSPNDPIAFALNRMDVGHFRHIPLVEGGVPVGIVSVRRILRYLAARCADVLTR